jgi:glutaredoxin
MITVYTIENCPYCTELKELLITEQIEFREVNINLDENKAEFEELNKHSKIEEVPVVRINKQLLVPNISFKSIKEAAELTKKILG